MGFWSRAMSTAERASAEPKVPAPLRRFDGMPIGLPKRRILRDTPGGLVDAPPFAGKREVCRSPLKIPVNGLPDRDEK